MERGLRGDARDRPADLVVLLKPLEGLVNGKIADIIGERDVEPSLCGGPTLVDDGNGRLEYRASRDDGLIQFKMEGHSRGEEYDAPVQRHGP